MIPGTSVSVIDGPWTGTTGVVIEMKGPIVRIATDDDHTIMVHVTKLEVG